MQHSAIHDARANAAPYQLKLADERRARQARFEGRVTDAPPIAPPVAAESPKPPEPWFYLAMLAWLVQRFEGEGANRRPRVEQIIRVVAECYDVTRDDILSARRTASIVRPRQIAMYLAKTLTIKSLPEIGRRMGRDHSTLCYGINKITRLRETDQELSEELDMLARALGGAA